uniref:Uncharacterized protein n=1 Tax=Pongo abelii TaxID=9601 RepID=A0A8I5U8Y3_PONAB
IRYKNNLSSCNSSRSLRSENRQTASSKAQEYEVCVCMEPTGVANVEKNRPLIRNKS